MKRMVLLLGVMIIAQACTMDRVHSEGAAPLSSPVSYLEKLEVETSGNALLCRYTSGETLRLTNIASACPPFLSSPRSAKTET